MYVILNDSNLGITRSNSLVHIRTRVKGCGSYAKHEMIPKTQCTFVVIEELSEAWLIKYKCTRYSKRKQKYDKKKLWYIPVSVSRKDSFLQHNL